MPQATPSRNRTQQRREEAQRRAARLRRQRLLTRIGAFMLAGIVAVAAVWWIIDRSGPSSAQALHQFDTNDFHSLAFDPVDADTVYFGHHGGLMVSNDGGESWGDTELQNVDAMQIAVPGAESNRMYAAGHNVFYVSADGGETWQEQANNLPGQDLHAFAGSPSDPMRLYAAPAGQGLFTSADGGATWEPISPPPGGATAPVTLAVAPDDPLRLYAGVGSGIAESVDGGRTWQPLPGPTSEATIITLAIPADEPLAFFAGTDQGLFKRTTDGSWRELQVETRGPILAVTISPAQPERIAVIDNEGNFFRSDDTGESWSAE